MGFDKILLLPRTIKSLIAIFADIASISLAFWGAYWVRLDDKTPIRNTSHWQLLLVLIFITLVIFVRMGLYRAILRYVGFRLLWTVSLGVFISTMIFVMLAFYFEVHLPRTVSVIYFAFSVLLIGGTRLSFRALINQTQNVKIPVIIYGAGASGRQLHLALKQGMEYDPIAFVDDDSKLQNTSIQGVTVYSPEKIEKLVINFEVQKILLAIPSAPRVIRQQVVRNLEKYPCKVLTIPGMADLVKGNALVEDLKEVSIEDILGRDSVEPVIELMNANIKNKCVMVTGAGGSIGSELCRQIIYYQPNKLILFELSEFSLYSVEKELNEILLRENLSVEIIPLLGSVQRMGRLRDIMSSFSVQTVYHAAAYKHVPLVEYNVVEGVRNNVFGTLYCAQAAIQSNVEQFVLISTDKAVRPTNTMGATKRLAELILQALDNEQETTQFCMVRFGNVLGSSGSVVPLFRQQIKDGGPITVTHSDIIRYFMTIPEAAQLVIEAGAMCKGGDVFVLDMGQPIKIIDLAKRMIRLSGLTLKDENNSDGDIEIKITGLRPGEKLFEELLIGGEVSGTLHPRIMTANEIMLVWSKLRNLLIELDQACLVFDQEKIRLLLLEAPAAFNPTDEICDLLWKAKQKKDNCPLVTEQKNKIDFIFDEQCGYMSDILH